MLINFLIVWFCLIIFGFIFWLYYLKTENPGVIDAGWSVGICLAGTLFILFSGTSLIGNLRLDVYWVLLLFWALRLGGYIWLSRVQKQQVEKRYLAISNSWRGNLKTHYFFHFQFQCLLMILNAIPFYFIANGNFSVPLAIDYFAYFLIIIGIVGESAADLQLARSRKNAPGKICETGLWFYSRHPNYFFEWIIWCGFAVGGSRSELGYWSFISPLFLLYLFLRVTGPITENQSLANKGKLYESYQKSTSYFFPWFKKTD